MELMYLVHINSPNLIIGRFLITSIPFKSIIQRLELVLDTLNTGKM